MINSLIQGFLNALFNIMVWFVDLLTTPFIKVLTNLFPDVAIYLNDFNSFLNDYVFRGLAFSREIFLNMTGFPRPLFTLLIGFIFGMFFLWIDLSGFLFIRNIFRGWKRGL